MKNYQVSFSWVADSDNETLLRDDFIIYCEPCDLRQKIETLKEQITEVGKIQKFEVRTID